MAHQGHLQLKEGCIFPQLKCCICQFFMDFLLLCAHSCGYMSTIDRDNKMKTFSLNDTIPAPPQPPPPQMKLRLWMKWCDQLSSYQNKASRVGISIRVTSARSKVNTICILPSPFLICSRFRPSRLPSLLITFPLLVLRPCRSCEGVVPLIVRAMWCSDNTMVGRISCCDL